MRVWFIGLAMLWAVCLALRGWWPSSPVVDLGRWRVVVIQSDDWGMEGWVPDQTAASGLPRLCEGVAPGLRAYCTSTLESGADIVEMSELLASVPDVDGLPAVLQANTVMAAIDVESATIRPSGVSDGAYRRPGLWSAVDQAIEAGTWWPELHGYTHYDVDAYRQALLDRDEFALQAKVVGTLAFSTWLRRSEWEHPDPAITGVPAAKKLFEERFGRSPVSVIAPDYRWSRGVEDVFAEAGLRVVQAKREQVDRSLRPGTWQGRLRKVFQRWQDETRDRFVYLDRPVRLEPYGNPSPDARQGAHAALRDAKRAWRRGEPAVVSIHRVQLVNLDSRVESAGRAQFHDVITELAAAGARFLVDAEVEQLVRSGVSVLRRGDRLVVRNYGRRDATVSIQGDSRRFPVGTHVVAP